MEACFFYAVQHWADERSKIRGFGDALAPVNGYDIEQSPKIADTNKDPDYLINDTIFD
ncbi:hypothetical protein PCURB6_18440 [Paenibacillus curdlanolyticus]|nr:hypothetical protein PCURB6_18440 [Paenibacillus curdlanolyticus]